MEIFTTNRIVTQTKEKFIYFHPVFTTLIFVLMFIYYSAFAYLSYNSFTNHKIELFVLYIITLIVLSPSFIIILKAFVRLLLNKPAIRLTQFRLYDHLNNIEFRWSDIKEISPFDLRWWSYLSVDNSSDPIIYSEIKKPLKYLFLIIKSFIKRRKILKINLLLLKGRNTDILATIKLYSRTK